MQRQQERQQNQRQSVSSYQHSGAACARALQRCGRMQTQGAPRHGSQSPRLHTSCCAWMRWCLCAAEMLSSQHALTASRHLQTMTAETSPAICTRRDPGGLLARPRKARRRRCQRRMRRSGPRAPAAAAPALSSSALGCSHTRCPRDHRRAKAAFTHLPAAAELAAELGPVALLEPQACKHVGDALVCIVPAHHGGLSRPAHPPDRALVAQQIRSVLPKQTQRRQTRPQHQTGPVPAAASPAPWGHLQAAEAGQQPAQPSLPHTTARAAYPLLRPARQPPALPLRRRA